MKATRLIFLLALMLSLTSPDGVASNTEPDSKPIKAVLEFYPNYAGHLLGVARIGYDSPYADTFSSSIRTEDLIYLQEHADLLQWSEGDEGVLSYFFLTFPGYINPESKQDLDQYLTSLNAAVAQKSFDEFREVYSDDIEKLDLWSGFNENELIFNYSEEIQSISKILMNNYDSFKSKVWPEYSQQLQNVADKMNEQFVEWDLIGEWESKTGMEFLADEYLVVLSGGMQNGPSGKALGYNKDWYYFDEGSEEMMQQVCREAGLRILHGLCSDQYLKHNPNICFQVYNTLSLFLTEEIMTDLGIYSNIDSEKHNAYQLFSIFDILHEVNPELKAGDLYNIALDTYSRSQPIIAENNK